ncbi:ricin-type beta-trefoil lectin domain protein [Streptomyces sp. NPDC001922]|uniref:ricin-type beta-trefoil lectin domain protein n=1 Tax=Streptomyces sp. NPDC001922 TaxID=3364624 RepID=UPI00368297AD
MPELHPIDRNNDRSSVGEGSDHPGLPDSELTEYVRAGAPTAEPAMQELRRRHLPAVLTYARLCSRNQTAGNQLAAQAFALAWPEVRRGIGPRGAWRHYLLTLVQQAAVTRAAGGLRDRLDGDFADWIDATTQSGADWVSARHTALEQQSVMLGAYYTLPQHQQDVLWYAVVDEEPDTEAATFLGVRPVEVPDLAARTLVAMRAAYLRTYLQCTEDRRCQGFRRLIEAAARPENPRRSEDLEQHVAECAGCHLTLVELTALGATPRAVLADGLLGWGGAAYLAAERVPVPASPVPAPSDGSPSTVTLPAQPPAPEANDANAQEASHADAPWQSRAEAGRQWITRPVPLAATAAAVLTAVLLTFVLAASDGPRPGEAGADMGRAPEPPPAATVTATVSSPARTPSPSVSVTTAPPKEPSSSHTASAPSHGIVDNSFSQVVNAASGLCLDIEDHELEQGNDVVTDQCSGTPTQQWRLDSIGLLHSYAAPDFCLDTRGDVDDGIGIWTCEFVEGEDGENLLWISDRAGLIRPNIAPDHALVPDEDGPGSLLDVSPLSGQPDQRWRAGAAPSG